VGVVSSSKNTSNLKSSFKAKQSKILVEETAISERNSGTRFKHSLKHSSCNINKIARLPSDDHKQVLKNLMKVHRRKEAKK
jgi:hypothetical protein